MMPAWSVEAPPIATAYLNTYLRKKNYDVTVFDFNIELYNNTPANKRYLFNGNQFNCWLPEKNFEKIILKNLVIIKGNKLQGTNGDIWAMTWVGDYTYAACNDTTGCPDILYNKSVSDGVIYKEVF